SYNRSVRGAARQAPSPAQPVRPTHDHFVPALSRSVTKPVGPNWRGLSSRQESGAHARAKRNSVSRGVDMKRNRSARIPGSSLLGATAALAGAQAMAQSPPDTKPQDTSVEEVIVTGSRIASPNATSTSPVLAVSHEDIQTSG